MIIPRKSKGIVEISENTKNISEIIKIPDRISGHTGILNISGLQYPIIPFFLTITEVFLYIYNQLKKKIHTIYAIRLMALKVILISIMVIITYQSQQLNTKQQTRQI